MVIAAAISRWASAVDGIVAGFLREPQFAAVLAKTLVSGVRRNPTRHPGWFTSTSASAAAGSPAFVSRHPASPDCCHEQEPLIDRSTPHNASLVKIRHTGCRRRCGRGRA
jgi:hypothetical protein